MKSSIARATTNSMARRCQETLSVKRRQQLTRSVGVLLPLPPLCPFQSTLCKSPEPYGAYPSSFSPHPNGRILHIPLPSITIPALRPPPLLGRWPRLRVLRLLHSSATAIPRRGREPVRRAFGRHNFRPERGRRGSPCFYQEELLLRFDSQAISEQYNIYRDRECGILGFYTGNVLRGARLDAQ